MDGAELHAIASKVLRDLDWESLRARYREMTARFGPVVAKDGYFGFKPYAYADGNQRAALVANADLLNDLPQLVQRFLELKKFGIVAYATSYDESGFTTLDLKVRFDATGRQALEGASAASG